MLFEWLVIDVNQFPYLDYLKKRAIIAEVGVLT